MKYQPFFHIALKHAYYNDEGCTDFLIAPDVKGEKVLRENRLLLNSFATGLSVLASSESGKSLTEIANDITFSFQLTLRNSKFHHFTELATIDSSLLYTNTSKGYDLQVSKEASGNQLESGVFGLIKLKNIAFKKEAPTFSLLFESKKIYWKYVVVTDEDSPDTFRIEQAGTRDEDSKIEFKTPVALGGNLDGSILNLLNQDYPQAKKIVIQSTTPITFFKGGRRNIQLKKDNLVLVEHLPNPRPEEGGIKVIKYLKNQKK